MDVKAKTKRVGLAKKMSQQKTLIEEILIKHTIDLKKASQA